MKNQKETKKGWGFAALLGLLCSFVTIEGNVAIALLFAGVFAFCAWKGGYMEGGVA